MIVLSSVDHHFHIILLTYMASYMNFAYVILFLLVFRGQFIIIRIIKMQLFYYIIFSNLIKNISKQNRSFS